MEQHVNASLTKGINQVCNRLDDLLYSDRRLARLVFK
jgi:hypothetical protein